MQHTWRFLRHTDAAGRVVDFHGLRVHFISRVVEAGANVKQAMELARHSDPKLTLRTYAKVRLSDLSAVLDKLPASDRPEPHRMRAMGTDDLTVGFNREAHPPHHPPQSSHETTRAPVLGASPRDGGAAKGALAIQ